MRNSKKQISSLEYVATQLKKRGLSKEMIAYEIGILTANGMKANADVADVTCNIMTSDDYIKLYK